MERIMKFAFSRRFFAFVALGTTLSMGTASVQAGPYSQSMDRDIQDRIDGYVWLYGEAAKGNDVARSNLSFLNRYYEPELAEKAKAAAIATWGVDVADVAK